MIYEEKKIIRPSDVYNGKFCTKETVQRKLEDYDIVAFRPPTGDDQYISTDSNGYVAGADRVSQERPRFIVARRKGLADFWE